MPGESRFNPAFYRQNHLFMNKKFFIIAAIVLILVTVGIFLARTFFKEEVPQKAFTPYISAYTSGIVSNRSGIRVMLVEHMPGKTRNQPLKKKVFDIKPRIKGKTYWADQRTIIFRPDHVLPSGTEFKIEFDLGSIMEVPEDKRYFHFHFQTIDQSYEHHFTGLRAYDPGDLQHQQVLGKVITADYAENEKVEQMLAPRQDGRELEVTWQHGPDGITHQYAIEEVRRKEKPAEVILEWDGSKIGAQEKDQQTITIPALDEFEIVNLNVVHQPEQYISVNFSDPLNEDQQLEGLIHFESGTSLKYMVTMNELRIYPEVRQTGKNKLIIEPPVENSLGYRLGERWNATINFHSLKPAVKFLGDGNILPRSEKGLILPFKAVNLSAVHVRIIKIYENNILQFFQENQFGGDRDIKRVGRIVYQQNIELTSDKPVDQDVWNTYSLDLSNMIETEPGAIYRVQINFNQSQSLYPCGEEEQAADIASVNTYDDAFGKENPGDMHYWSYRGYNHYNRNDDFNWRERNDPCKKSYYLRYQQAISKNILASDLGIIAKRGKDHRMFFAVTDLKTTEPLANIRLNVYNFQQQLIGSTQTHSDGTATIAYDSKPFLVVAEGNDQSGYLRVDDGSSLSLSRFNVSGRKAQKGLKGFIYGERGVWRPGDSIYLSFMLYDENKVLPEDHPVVLELINPRGQVAERQLSTKGLNGLYTFRTCTQKDAPTGSWNARMKVGGAEFNKRLRIETVKPNRLKMKLDFGRERFSSTDVRPSGTLMVKWLHGASASNLKADVKMNLTHDKTQFHDYPGYQFDDPVKSFDFSAKTIYEGMLDTRGRADIQTNLQLGDRPPGMLNTRFTIRAFEKSGNFSTSQKTIPYSPYPSYVGLKVPKGQGWHGSLTYGKTYDIPVVSVSEDGQPVDKKNLKIQVYKIRWRWWWERSRREDLSRYVGSSSRHLLQEGKVSTKNGKGAYPFRLKERYWGRVLIRVIDTASGHSAGKMAYITYPGWNRDQAPGGASMLTFTSDKDTYSPGEPVNIKLPASEGGRALVSLENGSKILRSFWINTSSPFTRFSFNATRDMAPNVYVHITLLQKHQQTLNDLPVRMYGVQPIQVEDKQTHLHPLVQVPEKIEPLQDVTIHVKEKKGKAMNYTVAVVDEGLLDITAYQTPQPRDHFYAREALGVKTWDLYNYVIGAFSGEMAGLYQIGGGMEMAKSKNKSPNRFKPVVKFFGPFHLNKNQTNQHTYQMPNYVGSVKTMVVACHHKAFGSAEQVTPVKKPLMVLATLPRVVGPREEITLPVTVFAMEEHIDRVQVKVETNNLLEAQNGNMQQVDFENTGDKVINFNYKVASRLGVARVKVTAVSGQERATAETEVQVRASNPKSTRVTEVDLGQGEIFSEDLQPFGMPGTNRGMLEVSRIMPLNLEKRLRFLISYPHGCIEQITSSAFPQLFLDNLLQLDDNKKKNIQHNVREGINKLNAYQLDAGGLAYWSGSDQVSHWGTNYALHFLLEAKEKGYSIPEGLLSGIIRYQKEAARNWTSQPYHDTYRNTTLMQAYRLFTLAYAGKPEKGAMNRLRKSKDLATNAKWRLAAAYQLTGKSNAALSLIEDAGTNVDAYQTTDPTYGSRLRDQAMILETLLLLDNQEKARSLALELGRKLGSRQWYSTQTTAYTLLALAKYLGTTHRREHLQFEYAIGNGQWKKAITESAVSQMKIPLAGKSNTEIKVRNLRSGKIFVRTMVEGIPAVGAENSREKNLKMDVRYMSMDGEALDPSSLTQGTDFRVKVTVSHPGIRGDYEELALTRIFPSGWEIHNFRLDHTSTGDETPDKPEYQDIRDDRVYTYFDLKTRESKTFVVQLNAAYLGRYYLPAVHCQAMYDHSVYAQKPGQWVEIVKPGE